jgi:hypothetical protein
MWEHEFFELFTTIIPQSFAFIVLFFMLSNIKVKALPYILFSVGLAVLGYFVRPYVEFGVHSSFFLLIVFLIGTIYGKVNIFNSLLFSLITLLIGYASEWFVFLLLKLLNIDMQQALTQPYIRAIIGSIPIVIVFIVSYIVYHIKYKSKIKN